MNKNESDNKDNTISEPLKILFGFLLLVSGVISLIVLYFGIKLLVKLVPMVTHMIYITVSFVTILTGGDVYEILESEKYQVKYPPEIVREVDVITVKNDKEFVVTIDEKTIKNVFHIDPWGSSNIFTLNTKLSIESEDNEVLEVEVPRSSISMIDVKENANYVNRKGSDVFVIVLGNYEFLFDFGKGESSVKKTE